MQPSPARPAFSMATAFLVGALAFCPRALVAQPAAGKLEQIRVHGAALDGNLSEQYGGDHGNRIKERFAAKLLPFFSKHLDAGK